MDAVLKNHQDQLAQKTIETLTSTYGFDPVRCTEAVEAIGDKGDVETAIGWLLDHGEEDRGGSIALKRCPHLDYIEQSLVSPQQLRFGQPCVRGCACGENWVCLYCGVTACSRYVNKHMLEHWTSTRECAQSTLTVADVAQGKQALGHHLALSLSDLSVWCYGCEACVVPGFNSSTSMNRLLYVNTLVLVLEIINVCGSTTACTDIEHNAVAAHVQTVRALKFGELEASSSISTPSGTELADVAVGDPLQEAAHHRVHGSLGDPSWAPPRITAVCRTAARPGYRSCAAHEYEDEPSVLAAKVVVLASMFRSAKHAVAYTGAGISTAAGVPDYASKSATFAFSQSSPLLAQPTYTHHALTALHRAGHLAGGWIREWAQLEPAH